MLELLGLQDGLLKVIPISQHTYNAVDLPISKIWYDAGVGPIGLIHSLVL